MQLGKKPTDDERNYENEMKLQTHRSFGIGNNGIR